jgi:acyl-CoA synthetase (AMP-forming)/AMP-acid ligase II
VVAVYGSTEAEPMAEIPLSSITENDFVAMARGHGLLAGKPVASLRLRILRNQWGTPVAPLTAEQFQTLCLGTDQVGEIVVSGEHVLPGYLNGLGDPENKFRVDGAVWHRTGDLGKLDQQGRLWLLGRASALIEDARGVVYPFAVECAARQVPGLRRAAILALDGKRILALEADSTVSAVDVQAQISWANVDAVKIMRVMPVDKRHNAKIDYVTLRRILASGK